MRTLIGPMQEFLHQSASGGIVLLIATVVALVLANQPTTAPFYFGVLDSYIGISIGPYELRETVLHWVNDGLMALFFFLVGLEIKRELWVGELSNGRAAFLPIAAAVGGAVVPALIYTALNWGRSGLDGWAVPMATDIAFVLGGLALLGNRVPFTLKVFLTAVAIVDDLIAVLVIALFYSSGLNLTALGVGALFLVILLLANVGGVRNIWVYALLGVVVWLAFLQSGIHATIAGVLVAFTIPARRRIEGSTFLQTGRTLLNNFAEAMPANVPPRGEMMTNDRQQSAVQELEDQVHHVMAPLQRLEHDLHLPVNFAILPIFALANAGVAVNLNGLGATELWVMAGIIGGLVVGKPIGLLATSYVVVRAGWAALPEGVTWQHVGGAGILAGVGFTMSLFIAALAFGEGSELLAVAKVSILLASIIAGVVGLSVLSRLPTRPVVQVANDE